MANYQGNFLVKYGNNNNYYTTNSASTPRVNLAGSATRAYDSTGLSILLLKLNTSLTVTEVSAYPVDTND